MLKYRSIQDRPATALLSFPCVIDEFSYDNNTKKRVKVGQKNIVAFVDAPRDDCEVYTKICRFNNGDLTALGGGNAQGIYTDISGMPTDYNTIMNSVKRANDIVAKSGKKSISEYLNSAFEQIRMEMTSKPTLDPTVPFVENTTVKETITNAK